MPPVLPFEAFLELLRAKGYGIGLHEYFAVAKLVERWDRTRAGEFRDALGALLGRSAEEVDVIGRLFDEMYLPERAIVGDPLEGGVSEPEGPDRWQSLKQRLWMIGVVAAMAIAVTMGLREFRSTPRAPVIVEQPPTPPPAVENPDLVPIAPPVPAPPRLPDPPRRVDPRTTVSIIAPVFLLILAASWWAKASDARRRWIRDAWSTALSALPGPHHFSLASPFRGRSLARQDVDDAATILGRAFTRSGSRELDVDRTLRLTLSRTLLPTLAFKKRRVARAILVFQDVSQPMTVWESKVDSLLVDLRRQGVPLERWYFDGDPGRVADRRHGEPTPLDAVLRQRPDVPLMFVSSGIGVAAALERPDEGWQAALSAVARRTWLTPISDLRLWPEAFDRLPIAVWPMTREGLRRAARELAGLESEPLDLERQRLALVGRVEADDIERLKRLASLVPHPELDTLDMLRREFAPDIPDAAIAHLMAARGPAATTVLQLEDDELQRCLDAVRQETPLLERAVRQTLLTWLKAARPPEGSAAYQRWLLAVAVQELMVGGLTGADVSQPLATIRALGRGPLWEEVAHATQFLPRTARTADLAALGPDISGPPNHVPASADMAAAGPFPWTWPGLRELVPAAIVASIVLVGGQLLEAFPARIVDHIQNAYLIQLVRADGASPVLQLSLTGAVPGAAAGVTVYQDDTQFRTDVALTPGSPSPVQLTSDDTGHYYQARSVLPDGNLALSNAVWVASDRLVTVLIDASPWANATLQGNGISIGPEPTPMTAQLMPGQYTVQLENGGVTPSLNQRVEVSPTNRSFRFVMPGFDATSTAGALVGGQRAR